MLIYSINVAALDFSTERPPPSLLGHWGDGPSEPARSVYSKRRRSPASTHAHPSKRTLGRGRSIAQASGKTGFTATQAIEVDLDDDVDFEIIDTMDPVAASTDTSLLASKQGARGIDPDITSRLMSAGPSKDTQLHTPGLAVHDHSRTSPSQTGTIPNSLKTALPASPTDEIAEDEATSSSSHSDSAHVSMYGLTQSAATTVCGQCGLSMFEFAKAAHDRWHESASQDADAT